MDLRAIVEEELVSLTERVMDRTVEGCAGFSVDLSDGVITVRHSTANCILAQWTANTEDWNILWETIKSLERRNNPNPNLNPQVEAQSTQEQSVSDASEEDKDFDYPPGHLLHPDNIKKILGVKVYEERFGSNDELSSSSKSNLFYLKRY